MSAPVLFLHFASCVCFSVLFYSVSRVLTVPVFWAFPRFFRCCFCSGVLFGLAFSCSAGGEIIILIVDCVGVSSSSLGSTSSLC